MKAISLWQPWASAIALGAKTIETRSWATSYRGPLLIHAAKRINRVELIALSSVWGWQGALKPLIDKCPVRNNCKFLEDILPFGSIVAVCDLVDCRPTGSFTQEELSSLRQPAGEYASLYSWTERMMGDFSLGRFGWVLKNIRAIEPFPVKGRQGLFDVEVDKERLAAV
jgi:hypothetical protein